MKQWHSLPRELVDSLSLETSKGRLDSLEAIQVAVLCLPGEFLGSLLEVGEKILQTIREQPCGILSLKQSISFNTLHFQNKKKYFI